VQFEKRPSAPIVSFAIANDEWGFEDALYLRWTILEKVDVNIALKHLTGIEIRKALFPFLFGRFFAI
jgi:hypothetical protein